MCTEMSVPVNFRGLPPHVLESVYTKSDQQRISRSSESNLTPLSFPKSNVALWDPTPNGDVVSLHLSYYRNPTLCVTEKALRLAHRHARQTNNPSFSCFLLGALCVQNDEEGVTLMLERFDPGREQPGSLGKAPTAVLPGDFLVPCTVCTKASTDAIVHSADDFNISFKMLQHGCCSREAMELSKLLTLRAHVGCSEHLDSVSFSLNWVAVTIANTLDAVPVRPIPIIPTALARNLSGPASLAQPLTASRKQGFLTMDQTRKLLLLLESDPKAYTLPLVGVWLSGVTHIHNPQVWAWCLRYLYSSSLQDRVMSEGGAFLVVLYSLTHRDPEFYQCQLCSGQQEMGFQLLSSTDTLTLYKHVEVSEGRALQFELSAEQQNQETDFFKEVLSQVSVGRNAAVSVMASPQSKLSVSDHDSGVEDEDLSPRPSPNPHPLSQQTKRVQPSVPELSLVMDGTFLDGRKGGAQEASAPLGHIGPPAQQRRGSCSRPSELAQPSGPPPIRRPLTPVIPLGKSVKGHSIPGQPLLQPGLNRRSGPPSGRKSTGSSSASSTSSSSSSSTPRMGCSPNSSVHQRRPPHLPAGPAHRGMTPSSPQPPHTSPTLNPPTGYRSPRHSSGCPNPPPAHSYHLKNLHSTPALNSAGMPCSCCSHQYGPPPSRLPSPWQGVSSTPAPPHIVPSLPGGVCCAPSESTPHRDCCCSPPSHQPLGCQSSPHQSPVCSSGSPTHHPSPHRVCTPAEEPRPHSRVTAEAQCCLGQPGYHVMPASSTLPVGLLPADAFRILVDQDRQLKLLQAQIQRLLEAQGKAESPSPPPTAPPVSVDQTKTQQESTVTQAQPAPAAQTRKCVSVAVSTGASLFWSSPADGPSLGDGPPGPEGQSEVEMGSGCAASSPLHSTAPSSFINSTPCFTGHADDPEEQLTRPHPVTPSIPPGVGQDPQSPVLGASANMCLQSQSPIGDGRCEEGGHKEQQRRFYQELLGQVNSRLQGCAIEGEEEEGEATQLPHSKSRESLSPPTSQRLRASPMSPPKPHREKRNSSPKQSEKDLVLKATLRQLKQLGVTVELDSADVNKATRTTVDSASTLACINPEAVVPRLALSESAGASMWGPSGSTDLSLEANAIALKYLSDSHLSQFSKGVQLAKPPEAHAVLLSRRAPEKSGVGLSILSPSNMSFATRKYMKKYGLMECGGSSEEEEVVSEEEEVKGPRQLDATENCAVGQGREKESSLVLKNITNELPHSIPLPIQKTLETQSQLLRDLRPRMQLLSSGGKKSTPKENCAPPVPAKQPPRPAQTQRSSVSEESVGNFLDLSRLRQLPKLF